LGLGIGPGGIVGAERAAIFGSERFGASGPKLRGEAETTVAEIERRPATRVMKARENFGTMINICDGNVRLVKGARERSD